jgi:ribose transport system substrate-binding protein
VAATAFAFTMGSTAASGAVKAHTSAALAPGVANAEKDLAKIEAPITAWHGPKTGPKLKRGVKIVIVSHQLSSPAEQYDADGIKAIADTIGWNVTVIDGQNQLPEEQAALSQAAALKPDAIVAQAIPNSLYPQLAAINKTTPVICLATAPTSGPYPSVGCSVNVFQNYTQLGQAEADWAIIHSGGHLHGIVPSDATYSIVTAKTNGIVSQFKKMGCTGCKVVLQVQTPFATASTELGTLVPAWLQTYGTPLWILSPTDYFIDYIVPALKTLGASPSKVHVLGMDGNPPNIDAIRSGTGYQQSDIAIPYEYLGYEMVDNVNRALNHQPFANYTTPIWVVDKSNINKFGEQNDALIPGGNYAQHYRKLWLTGHS